jgi:hypothetical protein
MGTGHVGAAIQRLRREFRPNAPAAPLADLRDDPLPTGEEALVEPFAAFRSWSAVPCDRCGQERLFNEAHSAQRALQICTIRDRMRHHGCGGRTRRWNCSPASRASAAGR